MKLRIIRRNTSGPTRVGVSLGLRRGYASASVKPPFVKRIGIRKRIY